MKIPGRELTPWLVLAALLLLSYAWFYAAGGWNQNSRFDLIRALVEQGTIRIDGYHHNTGDKAVFGGHVYSDKAPGQAFLAAPFVWAAQVFAPSAAAQSYLATIVTAGIPTVLAALSLAWVARRLGATTAGAMFAAVVYGIGTPAWAYATLLWGHQLAACGLIAGFCAAVALVDSGSARRDWWLGVGLGLAAGWAVVTEYPALPAAAILAGVGVASARGGGTPRMVRVAAAIACGALPCALFLLAYHAAAFGSPLATPLDHLWGFAHVREQPFRFPPAGAFYAILLGAKRGLLPLSPILLLAGWGFVIGLRRPGHRMHWLAAAAIALVYLLVNASFQTPLAGWCYGPRYLGGALPLWCLGLAPLFSRGRRPHKVALAAMAVPGIVLALVAVSTTPQPPEQLNSPVTELLWPAFRDGNLSLNHQSFLDAGADPARLMDRDMDRAAWNLGQRLGLRGHASLAPLLSAWAAALVLCLYRSARARRAASDHGPVARS